MPRPVLPVIALCGNERTETTGWWACSPQGCGVNVGLSLVWGFPSRRSVPIQSPLQMGPGWRCRQCTSKHGACSFPIQKAWEDRYGEKKFTAGNIIYNLFFLSLSEREWERKGHCNSTTRPIFTVICHLWSEQMKNDLQIFSPAYVLLHVSEFR